MWSSHRSHGSRPESQNPREAPCPSHLIRSFYIYRISAFNLVSVGETFYSPESSIPAAAVPTAPTVSFVTSTETTITVSWDIPTSDLTVTGFRLYAAWRI